VKADELASSPNPKGWLLNTLKNVIRNTVKSRARFGNIMMSIWSFDENMAYENAGDETIDAEYADLVVDKDYILLKKIIFEEYTMLEAAEELGLSLEACKKRIQRTKKKLRDQLKDI
jgi:RNA polymerase sigma-70 factor (ECF subfamily)